jgi:hypothetical protein
MTAKTGVRGEKSRRAGLAGIGVSVEKAAAEPPHSKVGDCKRFFGDERITWLSCYKTSPLLRNEGWGTLPSDLWYWQEVGKHFSACARISSF